MGARLRPRFKAAWHGSCAEHAACAKTGEFDVKLFASLLAAAALTAGSASAATNLVKNGGFEDNAYDFAHEFGASHVYGQSVAHWTSASTNAFNLWYPSAAEAVPPADARFNTRFPGEDQRLWQAAPSPLGGAFVALDGDLDYNGALTQTISGLTVGKAYELSFWWAAAQQANRVGATTEQFQVNFGAQQYLTGIKAIDTGGFSGWSQEKFKFTATNSQQVLSFLSLGTPNGLPPIALLDGVSLAAVPEPTTWAMMIAGFGLAGASIRRRKTRFA